jgi:DNA mismatch endonuclease (patch repair protein)
VRCRDTSPELAVRRALHARGVRFRLHRRDLPGRPDIVLPRYRLCIFVHGCFWHQHSGCERSRLPKTNAVFWGKKLSGNVRRDTAVVEALRSQGWTVEIVWACEIKKNLDLMLDRMLSSAN